MTISTELKKLSIPAVISLGILFYPLGEAKAATFSSEPQPFDLRTWTPEGDPANWKVSDDGTSVKQKKNTKLTFFVSPEEFINTTINGTFQVLDKDDHDFIGFVFGYQSPIAANGDLGNDMNFLLFDWKKKKESKEDGNRKYVAQEGFSLSKVNGTIDNVRSGFWAHESSPEFNVLATDYASEKGEKGWKRNTEYDFTLLYETDRIKIDIDGNTIFDISADEVGGEFQPGRFGYYNYSQANAEYFGFTHQDITPTPSDEEKVSTPEPSSLLGLLAFGAVGLTGLKRKKQQKAQNDSVS